MMTWILAILFFLSGQCAAVPQVAPQTWESNLDCIVGDEVVRVWQVQCEVGPDGVLYNCRESGLRPGPGQI